MKFRPAWLFIPLALYTLPGPGGELDDPDFFPPEPETHHVNEGTLEFLATPPAEEVHAHNNRITLTAASLEDGWASLYQCHDNLDSVPAAQIVYNSERIRSLQVAVADGIGDARVEGHTIQLKDVSTTAGLCINAESRVVSTLPGNGFVVRNGPFMRKFLDGYYPMHVRLEIILPPGEWVLAGSEPAGQPGFTVTQIPGGIVAEAWFEGKLETAFHFTPAGDS